MYLFLKKDKETIQDFDARYFNKMFSVLYLH